MATFGAPAGATSSLAEELVAHVEAELTTLVERHLPGFRLPGAFAGHEVLPVTRADLAATLGLLWRNGVRGVAGTGVADAVVAVLAPIDGPATLGEASYRVAETVTALDLLEHVTPDVVEACDSSSSIRRLLDGDLPRSAAIVLARCELARQRLGLLDDDTALRDLVVRARDLLAAGIAGLRSSDLGGDGLDAPDVHLVAEPLVALLGDVWEQGARRNLDVVARTMAKDGTTALWGPSSATTAACRTVELAGLARRLDEDADRWHARAELGLESVRSWTHDGLLAARHGAIRRAPGPLALALDCLRRLAAAALDLRGADPHPVADLFPDRDELVALDAGGAAAVWSYRSHDLAFVVPLVGSAAGVATAPHQPGLFEAAPGDDLPVGAPVVFAGGARYAPGGRPTAVEKRPGGLVLRYEGLARLPQGDEPAPPLPGWSEVAYRVDGRTLRIGEVLHLEEVPDAVAVHVRETTARPLDVAFESDTGHAATVIDTGVDEGQRSAWTEPPLLHQLDLDPATDLSFSTAVTPKLRIMTNARSHHYHRSLYDPLRGRVVEGQLSLRRGAPPYGRWDLFHLHWPEGMFGTDLAQHAALIEDLRRADLRIVWTQHNLVPHDRLPGHEEAYAAWAAATAGVIHHSAWGMTRIRDRYEFRPDAVHRVIPHGHFGNRVVPADRRAVESELGLTPGKRRLGIIGAPRPEKDVAMAIEAFVAAGRDDLELLVLSLDEGEAVPDLPGVVARPYELVLAEVYNRRLRAIDVLVLPFRSGDMLTTGTVGDAIGLGIPSIASDWGYLIEALGDAAIVYGQGLDALTTCIAGLDDDQLERAGAAARALQPTYDWATVAALTHELFEAVGTSRL